MTHTHHIIKPRYIWTGERIVRPSIETEMTANGFAYPSEPLVQTLISTQEHKALPLLFCPKA